MPASQSQASGIAPQRDPLEAPKRTMLRGLAIGGLALILLTAGKLLFIASIGQPTPFLTYLAATVVAAWYGGLAAGLSITAAAAITALWFFVPEPFVQPLRYLVPQVALFAVEGAVISAITARLGAQRQHATSSAAELREALVELDVVLRGIDEGITLQEPNGRLVFANATAARVCGFASADALIATPPQQVAERFELFDEKGKPFPLDELPSRIVLRGGRPAPVLLRFRRRDDHEDRWSLVRAKAIYGDDGNIEYIVNMFRDVTDIRRHDEALRVSREWFETALRSIGDAVVATDAQGKVTFLNPVAEELTGWSTDAGAGRPLVEVFPIINEDTRAPVESPVDRVIRDGVVVGLANHTILLRKDGAEVAIDDSAAPIRDDAGHLSGVVLVFRDVTDERRAAQRQAFLVDATHELNSSLDYTSTLSTVARLAVPTIADWCAVDIREAPGGEPEMLEDIPDALLEASAVDAEHLELLRALQLHSYIGVPLSRGGEVFGVFTLVMAESRRRYDAADLALALTLADRASIAIENARFFAAIEQARAEAVQANRAKDDFLALLGHELRNPLAPILTTLELIKMRGESGFEREHELIERQVTHLVRLVDDLLDISRITRGRVTMDKQLVDIADVVTSAVEMVRPLVHERAQHLHLSVPEGLAVLGDPVRLAQVVANLLTNSAKYTEPGGDVWVEGVRDEDTVVVRVRDNGIGIAPEMLQRIFELFVQEPQALDRSRGGLGLGLTLVQSLVSLHGGTVSAYSEGLGKGSEFVMALPAAGSTHEKATAPRSAARDTGAAKPAPAESARILLVDDNTDALEMLAELLDAIGLQPFTAATAEDALALAEHVRPTIALLDIGLPGMDGYELGRRLRQLPGLEQISLVALTGYGQPADRERSRDAGFAAHLVKPVELDVITRVLGELSQRT